MKTNFIVTALLSTFAVSAYAQPSNGNCGNGNGNGNAQGCQQQNVTAPPSAVNQNRTITVTTGAITNTNTVAGGAATTGPITNSNTAANTVAGGAATTGPISNNNTNNSAGGNSVNSISIQNSQPRAPVATALAPTIVHSGGADVCMGSTSGAVQGLTLGVSVGSTWSDKHCEALRASVRLNELGLQKTAAARLCQIPEIAEAFSVSGEFDCPKPKQKEQQPDTSSSLYNQ